MGKYFGTNSDDVFVAQTDENWTIYGNGGNDTLIGRGGNNIFYAGKGNDTLSGGAGDDTFYVGSFENFDSYDGGIGNDRIVAVAARTVIGISTLKNIEEISSGGFDDVRIKAGPGGLSLDFSKVRLVGIAAIEGGTGDDRIVGSDGDDVINGAGGNNILFGGAGNDTFLVGVGSGFNRFDGGIGTNVIKAIGNDTRIAIQSIANIAAISANGYDNVRIQGVSTGAYFDFSSITLDGISSISGGVGADIIIGSVGNDVIYGNGGDDRLFGGDGNDIIDGGRGDNYLNGGSGNDTFLVGTQTSLNT